MNQLLAHQVIKFIENLTLTDDYTGSPFRLRSWQKDILTKLYPISSTPPKRSLILLPRKQAKTTLLAGVVTAQLYLGSEGQEIYSLACTRQQAAILYDKVHQMILREPFLRQRAKFQATRKTMQVGNCRFQALSADVAGSFGSNPSFIVADEVAQYKDRKLWDAMTSGQGARKNARIVAISSAYQFDPESLIYELFTYACKVRDGIVEDDTFCPILYYLPLDKDWKDKSLWPKIMPALGDFCEEKFIEDEFKLALQMPTEEVKFRMLYLNQFLNNATPFIDMAAWDECREPPNPIGLCCGGLDMSSTTDLTAFALYFQDNSVKVWAWCPEDTVRKRVEGLRARYDIWIRQGLLKTTPGNTCDYDFIRRDINEISRQYSIAGIAVDPYNSTQMMTQLAADGFKVTSFRNSYVNMSSPIKQLQTLVLSKTLKHGGNPVLRWSASNLIVKQDSSGHLSPAKDKSTDSVDMMVACIMACGLFQSTPTSSCYDTGGLDYV